MFVLFPLCFLASASLAVHPTPLVYLGTPVMASKGKVRGELWLRFPAVPLTQPDKANIKWNWMYFFFSFFLLLFIFVCFVCFCLCVFSRTVILQSFDARHSLKGRGAFLFIVIQQFQIPFQLSNTQFCFNEFFMDFSKHTKLQCLLVTTGIVENLTLAKWFAWDQNLYSGFKMVAHKADLIVNIHRFFFHIC